MERERDGAREEERRVIGGGSEGVKTSEDVDERGIEEGAMDVVNVVVVDVFVVVVVLVVVVVAVAEAALRIASSMQPWTIGLVLQIAKASKAESLQRCFNLKHVRKSSVFELDETGSRHRA